MHGRFMLLIDINSESKALSTSSTSLDMYASSAAVAIYPTPQYHAVPSLQRILCDQPRIHPRIHPRIQYKCINFQLAVNMYCIQRYKYLQLSALA